MLGNALFEKDIIRERVKIGLETAKRKGKKLGRRSILTPQLLAKAEKMRSEGASYRQMGKRLRMNEGTIRKKIKTYN